jgi:hypothetical protein
MAYASDTADAASSAYALFTWHAAAKRFCICCCGCACRYVVARNAAEAAEKAAAQWGEGLVLVQVSLAAATVSCFVSL